MVKYFHHHTVNHHFDAPLISSQCEHRNEDNVRCRKRCLIGLYKCYIHLLSDHCLRIQPSAFLQNINVEGLGLYAKFRPIGTRPIVYKYPTTFHRITNRRKIYGEGDQICAYNGESISNAILNHRYHGQTAPYGVKINGNLYEDAATHRGMGSLINHTTRTRSNCRFSVDNLHGIVNIKCTRNIYEDDELLLNYGNRFIWNQPGVLTATNNKR